MKARRMLAYSMILASVGILSLLRGVSTGQQPAPSTGADAANESVQPARPSQQAAVTSGNVPDARRGRRQSSGTVGNTRSVTENPFAGQQSTVNSRSGTANPFAGHVQRATPWPGSVEGLRVSDPELYPLAKADNAMEFEARELVKQHAEAADDTQRSDLRKKLVELTGRHFDVLQQRRELEITRLEERIKRLREAMHKRSQLREQIVERRISQLLNEEDLLQFRPSGFQRPSVQYSRGAAGAYNATGAGGAFGRGFQGQSGQGAFQGQGRQQRGQGSQSQPGGGDRQPGQNQGGQGQGRAGPTQGEPQQGGTGSGVLR